MVYNYTRSKGYGEGSFFVLSKGQLLNLVRLSELKEERDSPVRGHMLFQISGLLCVAVAQRLTAKQCLLEPWMNPAIEVYPKENMRKLFRQVRISLVMNKQLLSFFLHS